VFGSELSILWLGVGVVLVSGRLEAQLLMLAAIAIIINGKRHLEIICKTLVVYLSLNFSIIRGNSV
jgi:hypothetical protein